MSYDLQIWSAEPVDLPPSPEGWSAEGAAWLKSGRNTHVTIWSSTPAESQDAPEEIAAAVPGLAWFTDLNLHPFDAPPSAVTEFSRLARKLAKPVRGAIYDPQTDTAHYPGPSALRRRRRMSRRMPSSCRGGSTAGRSPDERASGNCWTCSKR
jgi:hypothetical protein